MEEIKEKENKNVDKKEEVKKIKLSVPTTVLLSIVAVLGLIVLFRIIYFFVTGM